MTHLQKDKRSTQQESNRLQALLDENTGTDTAHRSEGELVDAKDRLW